jgi:hypothetical protein
MMKCEVCGRNPEQLNEEFGIDAEIKEHQGLDKCTKCIKEYERELGVDENTVSEEVEDEDWKSRIVA